MALKSMSVKKAMEIYNLYSDIVGGNNPTTYGHYYPYSALKGYDVFDVDNAIKLFLANQVYNRNLSVADIDKMREWGKIGVNFFTMTFMPDEYAHQLDKLILGTDEYRRKFSELELLTISPPIGMYNLFVEENKEGADSVFDFCLSLGRNHPNYWKEVYKRLGIEGDL